MASWLGAAAVVGRRHGRVARPPATAVLVLGAAVAVNVLTRTGAPLRRPSSGVQGHGAWHVPTAVAASSWLAAWPARAAAGRRGARRHATPVPSP